jgi:hypothetical protein
MQGRFENLTVDGLDLLMRCLAGRIESYGLNTENTDHRMLLALFVELDCPYCAPHDLEEKLLNYISEHNRDQVRDAVKDLGLI